MTFKSVPQTVNGKEYLWRIELTCSPVDEELFIKCPVCDGQKVRNHFRSYDDDEGCNRCGGVGTIQNPNYVRPIPPESLFRALEKVMRDEWNKAENERFKLT
jgi:phosphoribosylamine-glycine ligase